MANNSLVLPMIARGIDKPFYFIGNENMKGAVDFSQPLHLNERAPIEENSNDN